MKFISLVALSAFLMGCGFMEYRGMQGSQSQPVSYAEKDGKIVLESICAEQKSNPKNYYKCSANADVWLDAQCASYKAMYTSSDPNTTERYRREYNKYCDAAAAWEKPTRPRQVSE